MLTQDDFLDSLEVNKIPAGISKALEGLWYDAKGNWEAAHEAVQSEDTLDCAWVHAYLHRKEGDKDNARYWYSQANRPLSQESLNEEWSTIVESLFTER
jgi:hypothetical protein